jgi:hypothetical protein
MLPNSALLCRIKTVSKVHFSPSQIPDPEAKTAPDPGSAKRLNIFAILEKLSLSATFFERTYFPSIIYGAKKEKNLRIQNKKSSSKSPL